MSVSRGEGIEFKQKLLVTERSICVYGQATKYQRAKEVNLMANQKELISLQQGKRPGIPGGENTLRYTL
jgi:hypothetical protein